jgi:methionyl-tRNA formyltransferase
MRIVIMGTGGFAVPTFEQLLGSRHDIVAVVTMPMRDPRSANPVTTPVRSVASAAGLEIFDP